VPPADSVVVEVSRMPVLSRAQSRLMHGIANGSIPAGHGRPSKQVADEFVAASHGQKVRNLPEHVAKKAEGGGVESAYPKPFVW
jgi:hypothetical protein